jgi:hypothetical protein
MDKWFITEEWNESDQLQHGRRTSHVDALGLCSEKDIETAQDFMERYSPFDYIDSMTYDTEEEYERMLTILEQNGSTIKRNDA